MSDHLSDETAKPVAVKFNNDPVDSAARITRKAVLYPLATTIGKGEKFAGPLAAGTIVLSRWRTTIRNLDKYDEENPADPKIFSNWNEKVLACNCCPSSIRVDDQMTLVCRRFYCPWCFGRRAESVIRLAGITSSNRPARLGNAVYASYARYVKIQMAGGEPIEVDLRKQLYSSLVYTKGFLGQYERKIEGGSWHIVAQPFVRKISDKECLCWRISARAFLYLKPDKTIDLYPNGWRVKTKQSPSKKWITSAMIRMFEYPRSLMGHRVDLLHQLIVARRGLRLSNMLGDFRGAGGEEENQ